MNDSELTVSETPDQSDLVPMEPEESDDGIVHFKWKVTKNLTRRIDQYLVDRVGYLSRNGVQRLIDEELVKVNGKKTKSSYHPRNGDEVEMFAPPEPVNELVPENIPLDIVYEDEHFLALNKQKDLIVHPARGRWSGTLVNGLVYYGMQRGSTWSLVNGDWRPGILHRLDRNTTGIMLVAKTDEAHWRIARQFENRTIQKTYMAICHGVPELLGDVIDLPIGKDRYIREKQAVRSEANGGRSAVTKYEVQESFAAPPGLVLRASQHPSDKKLPPPPAGKFSLIKLTPKTGRTHQLRVHMSVKGFPMVGDTMYGGRILEFEDFRFERQALHAYEISFVHPVTLDPITIKAPLPEDFNRVLSILGARASGE